MKNFLILLAVVLVGAGVYWKFRDRIHGKVEELQNADGKDGGSIADRAKSVISGTSTSKADEKVPLISSDTVRGLPDSLSSLSANGQKADLLLETSDASETGVLPPQIRFSSNAWLDSSGIQLAAGTKPGTFLLVHLLSASPSNADAASPHVVIQCASEPAPAGLQESVKKSAWRAPLPAATSLIGADEVPVLWITEFAALAKRGELRGNVSVEGTFGALRRASGNQNNESINFEEAKELQFFFAKGTMWNSNAQEAEQLRKQGHRVTLKLLVRTGDNPKYFAQEVTWRAPVKDKYQHWRQTFLDRKSLRGTLALASWAEMRGLTDEAREMYEASGSIISRDSAATLGKPRVSVRLHFADEVQDHRIFDSSTPVVEEGGMQWQQRSIEETLCSHLKPTYLVLHTNSRNEATGSIIPLAK